LAISGSERRGARPVWGQSPRLSSGAPCYSQPSSSSSRSVQGANASGGHTIFPFKLPGTRSWLAGGAIGTSFATGRPPRTMMISSPAEACFTSSERCFLARCMEYFTITKVYSSSPLSTSSFLWGCEATGSRAASCERFACLTRSSTVPRPMLRSPRRHES
jgi:hypothetical protein